MLGEDLPDWVHEAYGNIYPRANNYTVGPRRTNTQVGGWNNNIPNVNTQTQQPIQSAQLQSVQPPNIADIRQKVLSNYFSRFSPQLGVAAAQKPINPWQTTVTPESASTMPNNVSMLPMRKVPVTETNRARTIANLAANRGMNRQTFNQFLNRIQTDSRTRSTYTNNQDRLLNDVLNFLRDTR